MRPDERDDAPVGQAGRRPHGRQHRSPDRPGIGERRQHRGVQPQPRDQLIVPVPGPRIDQSGRRRVGALGDDDTGQPVPEQVGQRQHPPHDRERRRDASRLELVDRVDRHELEAGARVEVCLRDPRVDPVHRRHVSRVAVMDRVADQDTCLVEHADVHAPRVDADAPQVGRDARRAPEPGQDLVVQPQRIPVQPVVELDRLVREAVDLLQRHPPARDPADDHAAARGAEVDRRDGALVHRPASSLTGHRGPDGTPRPPSAR